MMLSESQEIKHKIWYIKENCNLLGLVLIKTFIVKNALSGQEAGH